MLISGVSVVIPTYNRAHLLHRSIQSVLNQTYNRFELLIVDDCSTDNTEEVVKAFDDSRIKYIRCETNGGAAAARNRGILEAKYDWIAFLDSDDVWREEKLEKQIASVDGTAGLIYCTFKRHPADGSKETLMPSEERPADRRNGIVFGELLLGNFVGMPTIMVHKSVLNDAGTFNSTLRCYEDYEFFLRASQYTRFCHVDEILVDVYETEESVGQNVEKFFESITYIMATYKDIYDEINYWEEKTSWLFEIARNCNHEEKVKALLSDKIAMLSKE